MFSNTTASKATAAHLAKPALLYVRQSTLKQVIHHTESAHRQYDLRSRAIALGWSDEQIIVIDIDQGQSRASAADREGFQHLVAEVSLGRAGIVLGLECSRLARNSADWHQLLELCGITGTLICGQHRQRVWRDWESATSLLRRHVHVNACWLYGQFLSDDPEPEVVSCVYWAEDLELSKAHLNPASGNILQAFAQRGMRRRVVGVRVDTLVVAWHCQPDTQIEDHYLPQYLERRGRVDDYLQRMRSGPMLAQSPARPAPRAAR